MSSVYTPNAANNPASITIPSDGDPKAAASVNVALEGLADKVSHANWPETNIAKQYPLANRSISRVCVGAPMVDDFTKWLGTSPFLNCLVATKQDLYFPVQLPNGSTWVEAHAIFLGAAGHAAFPGGAPATMPVMRAVRFNPLTATIGVIASHTDASASAAVFQAIHALSIVGMAEVVDTTTYNYFIKIETEGGAGGIAGDQVYGAQVVYSVSEQDPGAA